MSRPRAPEAAADDATPPCGAGAPPAVAAGPVSAAAPARRALGQPRRILTFNMRGIVTDEGDAIMENFLGLDVSIMLFQEVHSNAQKPRIVPMPGGEAICWSKCFGGHRGQVIVLRRGRVLRTESWKHFFAVETEEEIVASVHLPHSWQDVEELEGALQQFSILLKRWGCSRRRGKQANISWRRLQRAFLAARQPFGGAEGFGVVCAAQGKRGGASRVDGSPRLLRRYELVGCARE